MEIRDWLKSYRELLGEVAHYIERAQYWRDKALGLSATTLSVAPGGEPTPFDECILEFMEYSDRCRDKAREAAIAKDRILDAIDSVGDTVLRRLLKLHYIDGMRLSDVAVVLGYSYGHIRHLHTKALECVRQAQLNTL